MSGRLRQPGHLLIYVDSTSPGVDTTLKTLPATTQVCAIAKTDRAQSESAGYPSYMVTMHTAVLEAGLEVFDTGWGRRGWRAALRCAQSQDTNQHAPSVA